MDHTKYSEHEAFYRGDLVRVRMTPEIVGQVIDEAGWGKQYLIRYGGSSDCCWYQDVELEPFKAKRNGGYGSEPEDELSMPYEPLPVYIDNVIDLEKVKHYGGKH